MHILIRTSLQTGLSCTIHTRPSQDEKLMIKFDFIFFLKSHFISPYERLSFSFLRGKVERSESP